MRKMAVLTEKEMKIVNGGGDKYYGNGLYCNKEKCYVNWGQAVQSIGQISAHGWINGLAGSVGSVGSFAK